MKIKLGAKPITVERETIVFSEFTGIAVEEIFESFGLAAPHIYRYGETLVQVIEGKVVPLNRWSLIMELNKVFNFQREKGKGAVASDPTMSMVQQYLSASYRWTHWKLRGVSRVPLIHLTSGKLTSEEGYNADTRTFIDAPDLDIPESPVAEQAAKWLFKLRTLIRTFPFADSKRVDEGKMSVVDLREPPGRDETKCLAAMLTACARPSLPMAPMFALAGPQGSGSATGKTMFTVLCALLATGERVSPVTPDSDPKEFAKQVIAQLREGEPVMLLEECSNMTFGGPLINSILTSPNGKHRVLGVSQMLLLPHGFWLGISGNNLSLQYDTARRAIQANFSSTSENPEMLEFTFDPLKEAADERVSLLTAVFGILRYGITAKVPRCGTLGTFEAWSRLIVDVLVALKCPNVLEDIAALRQQNESRSMLEDFIRAFWNAHGSDRVALKDLRNSVQVAARNLVGKSEYVPTSVLGTSLKPHNLATALGFRLHHTSRGKGHAGSGTWHLEWTNAASTPPERDPPGERMSSPSPLNDAGTGVPLRGVGKEAF